MNPDLMHPASERSAEDHAGLPVVVHPLELGPTFFALRGHLQKNINEPKFIFKSYKIKEHFISRKNII